MNTPKKRKRHTFTFPDLAVNMPTTGDFAVALANADFAARLGYIAADFEHLEDEMAKVLGVLLGDDDEYTAGYLLRSIRAPRARFDLMHNLLTLAPGNKELGDEYDALINEFQEIGRQRNNYIHGRWYTNTADNSVYYTGVDEHGWSFLRIRPAMIEEMDALIERIGTLRREIISVAHIDLLKRRRAKSPPLSREQRVAGGHPKGAPKGPRSPRQSTRASPRKRVAKKKRKGG